MSWQWVTVLGIIVFAWTVLRVTAAWQTVTAYRYSPEATKKEAWDEYMKTINKIGTEK